MKLKNLIETLKEYDMDSEVWINYAYYDSNKGKCYDSSNKFGFVSDKSSDNKPILEIYLEV